MTQKTAADLKADELFGTDKKEPVKVEKTLTEILETRLFGGGEPIERIVYMNAPILTSPGRYEYKKIEEPRKMFHQLIDAMNTNYFCPSYLSAVGHPASVEAFKVVMKDAWSLEKPTLNRIEYKYQPGDFCIILKMRGRIPEGTILNSLEEMEKIGFDLFALYSID